MSKKRTMNEIRQVKDSIYTPPAPKLNKTNIENSDGVLIIPQGWWLQISPLARITPEEWIVGVLRKGKASWITEKCEDGFETSQDAYNWGIQWIKEYEEKKKN